MPLTISILWVCTLAIGAIVMIRNETAYRNHMIIGNAIHRYAMYKIAVGDYACNISYDDMEPYGKTMLRFWDFGYTKILPPEKYELIKPFIK